MRSIPAGENLRRADSSRLIASMPVSWVCTVCFPVCVRSAALPVKARVTFEVGYVEAGGVERRVPLAHLAGVAPEYRRLVRSFPSYKGQRNFPGLYWSASRPRRTAPAQPPAFSYLRSRASWRTRSRFASIAP